MKTLEHGFDLPFAPEKALPLFTPRGEEAWVPDWAPRYLSPTDGRTTRAMVFTTGDGADQTLWTCLDYAPADGHARYFRAVPGSRISIVEVFCHAADAGSTRVTVRYTHLPLGAQGEAFVREQTPERFATEIAQWRDLIITHCPHGAVGAA